MAKSKSKTPTAAANAAIAPTPEAEVPKVTMNTDATPEAAPADTAVIPNEHVADGTPAEEVAGRSADVDADSSVEHIKEFVLGPGTYTEAAGYNHDANKSAVRQYMISQGLRPVGDVEFVSNVKHADGKSRVLKYKVTAVPAHLATDPDVAHARVIQGTGDTSIQPEASKA